jgi:hypothetical protein
VIDRVRRRALTALERRLDALGDRLTADADRREAELRVRLAALEAHAEAADGRAADQLAAAQARAEGFERHALALEARLDDLVVPLLRAVADDEAGNRRRLWALREDPDYPRPWEETEPLVTISIATRDRLELLLERALPSVIGQSYERLQVVVVGDAAPPEVGTAVAAVGDPRITYINLPTRVRGPEGRHWLTAATLTRNEAYRVARGSWVLDFDDDDALDRDAVELLLEHARATRAEVVYGDVEQHRPGMAPEVLGGFPPRLGGWSFAAALVHGGLRFFAREHVAASLGLPGDWYRAERMLRAGVRFAHRPGTVFRYYPSQSWGTTPAPPEA